MARKKRIIAGAATALMAAGTVMATAPSASADSAFGCSWPRVCFYLTDAAWAADSPTAAYQDITSGYQTLGAASRGSNYVYNSRNDDVAYLHLTNGAVICLTPSTILHISSSFTVDKIRISSAATC